MGLLRSSAGRGLVLVISIVMVLTAIALPFAAPTGASPNPIPILTLSLSPTTLRANVSSTESGTVSFEGTVTVEQMQFVTSTTTLTATTNQNWSVTLSQSTFSITGDGSASFTASVVVPAGTSEMLTGNLIVTGSCKVPLLSAVIAAASAVVTVYNEDAHGKWTLVITAPLEGATVDTATVTMRGTASYTVEAVERVECQACNGPWVQATGTSLWQVELDVTFLEDGPHTLFVRAFSASSSSDERSVNITLALEGEPAPGVQPDPSGGGGGGDGGILDSGWVLPLVGVIALVVVVVSVMLYVKNRPGPQPYYYA